MKLELLEKQILKYGIVEISNKSTKRETIYYKTYLIKLCSGFRVVY